MDEPTDEVVVFPSLLELGVDVVVGHHSHDVQAAEARLAASGAEPLALPAGPVSAALRLVREPARPYDQRIEVWLDPARAHLPVQVRLQTVPGPQDATTEWRLAAAEAGAR